MSHFITGIIIADAFRPDAARQLDLVPVPLVPPLALFHLDHYYTAYWQAVRGCTTQLDVPAGFPGVFPREGIIPQLVAELTGRDAATFALIQTEYFGGIGGQWAIAFTGDRRESSATATINDVLRFLGVACTKGLDEFDTVGLGAHRTQPDYLGRYVDLCDQLGA